MKLFAQGMLAIALGCALMALPGCTGAKDPWPEGDRLKVLTSFAPLHCFALNVAGDRADVLCLMSETGPHHFDPSPQHAKMVRKADLFLVNGLDLDATAQRLARSARNPNFKMVDLSRAIPESDLREGGCSCGHDHGPADHDHSHDHDPRHIHIKQFDPHIWLGLPEAIKMVGRIRDALVEMDPAHADEYKERAAAYIAKLEQLHADGKALLAEKTERKLLAFHDSLFYFTRSFDLELTDAIESSPGTEPSTQALANLVKTCKEKGVRHIAIEPQYDANNSAKVILKELRRREIAAEFVTVNTLETARAVEMNADWYETRMRENLKNLASALK